MAEFSYCMDSSGATQELCDTDRFIGSNRSTISIDTKTEQYSEIQSQEIADLGTPKRLCNIIDNTEDLDHERPNDGTFDKVGCDLSRLDISQNNTGVKLDISEDSGVKSADPGNDSNQVSFDLGVSVGSTGSEIDSKILAENLMKMDDNVFKEDIVTKAKSETNLENYSSSHAKVRKLRPDELTSPSSTTDLGRDINSKVAICRRQISSGSDPGKRSRPVSEEFYSIEDVTDPSEFPPCDCDECLFSGEQDRPIPPPDERKLVRKQSSWKKIRNIVHWSPFIQQFKRRRYPWIQLAGHQGNFHAGEQPGAILKKFDSQECQSFHKLMKDVLRPYVPEFRGEAYKDGERCIQLQDLLCEFEAPCVMDIKMGCRTYLEQELTKAREKPSLRKDMYQKMVEVDPNAPTPEEHAQKAITKPRYMQWRDEMSSSAELGFRIEGIRKSDGANIKNFKTTKQKSCIKETLRQFVSDNDSVMSLYLRRLKSIQATQEASTFFKSHEIIGSSLLFVHDKTGQASIWMIDFGKTVPLSENITVDHRSKWVEGNHEDGYLCGINSLIEIFEDLVQEKHENLKKGSNSNSVSNKSNEKTAKTSSSVTESEPRDIDRDSEVNKDSNQRGQNDNTSDESKSENSSRESHC